MSSGNPALRNKEKAEGRFVARPRSQSGESNILSRLIRLSPGDGGKGVEGPAENGREGVATKEEVCGELNGHADVADIHRTLKGEGSRGLRKSRSYEDILTAHRDSVEPDFCLLSYTEPDEIDTGGAYDIIFDDCEYLSDEDIDYDRSAEVRDLTPMDPAEQVGEGVDGSRMTGVSMTPPRASIVLINAFLQRIESVMVNGVHYPPGLFFVQ